MKLISGTSACDVMHLHTSWTLELMGVFSLAMYKLHLIYIKEYSVCIQIKSTSYTYILCVCLQVLADQQCPNQTPDHGSAHVHNGHPILRGDPSVRLLALPTRPTWQTGQVPLLWHSEVWVHLQLQSSHHASGVQDSEHIAQTGGAPAPHWTLWYWETTTGRTARIDEKSLRWQLLLRILSKLFCHSYFMELFSVIGMTFFLLQASWSLIFYLTTRSPRQPLR